MKVLKNLLKFISITILTIYIITSCFISIAFSTILNKDYIIQKLEENNFYSETHKLVESNFENYIYQSGFEEDVIQNICTEEKVKNDINIMLSNIYDGTKQEIDTIEIANKLNENIEKSGVKNSENEKSIQQFVEHICNEYTNTLIHTKYEEKVNDIYIKIVESLNEIYRIIQTIFILDIIVIIAINKKNISKVVQYFEITLFAASFFEASTWHIIISKVNIQGIKIFNEVFSKSIVIIIQETITKILSLSIGTMIMGIIFCLIYIIINILKLPKEKIEKNKTKEI